MKILEYYGLDTSKVKKQYEKVIGYLEKDDFRSAEVKKLIPHDLYRAKLGDSNRLIFKIMSYNGDRYAVILELVLNHAYEKSRFLRGARVDESKLPPVTPKELTENSFTALSYVNPSTRHFYFLDKILSFDPEQQEVYTVPLPVILIGPAGSGKTVVTLEKIRLLSGKGLYVTLSRYLVDYAEKLYYSHHYENENQELSFLSFKEFLESIRIPEGKEVTYQVFSKWIERFPKKGLIGDAHRLYEEIRGVITGASSEKPWLTEEEYVNLGVKRSIFLPKERPFAYGIFERYLRFLKENNYYDPNVLAYQYLKEVEAVYDFLVVDEVQDITNIQLQLILKCLKNPNNFILSGDSNQIVHPNFFSWSGLKSMLYNTSSLQPRKITRILNRNFRNSLAITELSNRILMIKQRRFGSIDRESAYLMKSVSNEKGDVFLLKETDKIKSDLNRSIMRSTKYAVLVMQDEQKQAVKRFFNTPLIFSVQEAKGLEYENVILVNFISNAKARFNEIIEGINPEDLQGDIQYMRASDKTDKSLEVYKFFVNSLYVAITRAIKRVYLIESEVSHPFLRLVGLMNSLDTISVKLEQSTKEEWQKEARKLELQGKYEQAEEIRRRILKTQPVPWEVLTNEEVMKLVSQIQTAKDNPQKPRKRLFEYALFYDAPIIIKFLSRYAFDKAKQIFFDKEGTEYFNRFLYEQQRKNLTTKYLQKYTANLSRDILRDADVYGVDHLSEFGKTSLMLACETGNIELVKELLDRDANPSLTDNFGLTAWQNALKRAVLDKDFAASSFLEIHELISPLSLSINVDGKLIKIDRNQGEFLLFHLIYVLLNHRFNAAFLDGLQFIAPYICLLVEGLPENVVPSYRKKRQYISSLLSKNEQDSTNPYCKKLFKRIRKGHYIINPVLKIKHNDEWVSPYKLSGVEFIANLLAGDEQYFSKIMRVLINP